MGKFSLPRYLSVRMLQLICFAAASVLYISGLFLPVAVWMKIFICAVCVVLIYYDNVIDAVIKLLKEQRFDPAFLVVAAMVGAFAVGQAAEGTAAILLYKAGGLFYAVFMELYGNTVGRILDQRPETLSAVVGGALARTSAGKLRQGDVYSVSPGERIALDGEVVSGESTVDEYVLTGAALPRSVARGSAVTGGSLNLTNVLNIRAKRTFDDSDAAHILKLVNNAGRVKPRLEKLIARISRFYLPATIAAAMIVGLLIPLIGRLPFIPWFMRGLTLLLLSNLTFAAGAAVITYFAGIGGAAGRGIVFKGAGFVDSLAHATSIIFTKTGTLTSGRFEVADVHAYGMPADRLMTLAAYAELNSEHAMARTIVAASNSLHDPYKVTSFREYQGLGAEAEVAGNALSVGNARMMTQLGITPDISQTEHSVVYVAVGGKYAGRIILSNPIKPDAKKAVRNLHALGLDRIVIFTGDKKETAAEVASSLGITEFYADCLPDEKLKRLKALTEMQLPGDKLVFVGDGVTDAAALHTADIGVVLGGFNHTAVSADETGPDVLMKEADLVIMTDEVSKVPEAIMLTRGINAVARQNVLAMLVLKALVLLLVIAGILPIWAAMLAETAAVVLTTLNATRADGFHRNDMKKTMLKNKKHDKDAELEQDEDN